MKPFRKLRIPALFLIGTLVLNPFAVSGQDKKPADTKADSKPEFQMTMLKQIPATSVKSQASTSTCWCFSTTSMIESEIMRLGKPEVGLSEMWNVYFQSIN